MSILSNAHAHTVFCDGRDTVEDMVLEAIRLGFVSIGLSIHGWTPYEMPILSLEKEAAYRAEVARVREKYAARIEVICGAERDALYERDFSGFDYLIDSTHYFMKDGEFVCVDDSADRTDDAVHRLFGDDYYAYCRAYFEREAEVCAKSDADFIGHIDLVRKFNQRHPHFDETDPRFLSPAMDAVNVALERNKPIEINTGAIARGYRSDPYPAVPLLKLIREKGGEIIINSDAHSAAALNCAFDESAALAKECGFDHVLYMRADGLRETPL